MTHSCKTLITAAALSCVAAASTTTMAATATATPPTAIQAMMFTARWLLRALTYLQAILNGNKSSGVYFCSRWSMFSM